MRVNLGVRYEDRHEARAVGARWDAARRTWYVIDTEDLAPFMRWLPMGSQAGGVVARQKVNQKPGVATRRTDFSLPDCGCIHVASWEDCEHTKVAARNTDTRD